MSHRVQFVYVLLYELLKQHLPLISQSSEKHFSITNTIHLRSQYAVSYTHLDVYKRQVCVCVCVCVCAEDTVKQWEALSYTKDNTNQHKHV